MRELPIRLAVLAAALLALAVPAFWPQYLSKPASADRYTHVHAALGLLWLLALIAQPLLIRARELQAHRVLGRVAAGIGAAFVVSGLAVTHHRVSALGPEALLADGFGYYLPFVMAAIFAAALSLGLRWRRSMPVHARFMACTGLTLLDPVFGRLLFFHGPHLPWDPLYQVPSFLVMALVLFELHRTLPRATPGRSAFGAFALAAVLALAVYFLLPQSAAWAAFLEAFRSLPLT